MMALDSESIADEDDDFDDDGTSDALVQGGAAGVEPMKASLGRLRFSVLLQTIQQDTQTRLVFRAQAVIQSEVLHFVPGAEDLKYPEKLDAHKDEGLTLWTEDERLRETEVGGFRMPREEVQVTWYPTLKRTVWVLSKLNTYVNVRSLLPLPAAPNADLVAIPQNAIFEDFAGEAVTLCRQSLSIAAVQVAARSPEAKTDGQLFLIRHLLLLKEMIRSVDLVQIERAADFSSVTGKLSCRN